MLARNDDHLGLNLREDLLTLLKLIHRAVLRNVAAVNNKVGLHRKVIYLLNRISQLPVKLVVGMAVKVRIADHGEPKRKHLLTGLRMNQIDKSEVDSSGGCYDGRKTGFTRELKKLPLTAVFNFAVFHLGSPLS